MESGVRGHKALHLQKHFPGAAVPDLQTSLYNVLKKNSVPRCLLRVVWAQPRLLLTPRFALHCAVRKALEGCAAEVPRAALQRCDVIVGSSWGGAVAMWLLANGRVAKSCRVVLLAPAFARAMTYGLDASAARRLLADQYASVAQNAPGREITVVHGRLDRVVPLQDSADMCVALGAKLVEIPGGDHKLNLLISSKTRLLVNLMRHGSLDA
jgi:hypothetical protein